MITKPTVLILGAGVSIPYGYSSGADLVKNIVMDTHTRGWKLIYDRSDIKDEELNNFRSELLLSQKPSIDAFLEHRTEYMKPGKIAIALSLPK